MPRDPTARGDVIAMRLRQWYEANRESWWDRHAIRMVLTGHALGATPDRYGEHADEFMLGLVNELRRIDREESR